MRDIDRALTRMENEAEERGRKKGIADELKRRTGIA